MAPDQTSLGRLKSKFETGKMPTLKERIKRWRQLWMRYACATYEMA